MRRQKPLCTKVCLLKLSAKRILLFPRTHRINFYTVNKSKQNKVEKAAMNSKKRKKLLTYFLIIFIFRIPDKKLYDFKATLRRLAVF